MTGSESDLPGPHRRRARYPGTHPRRFEEKYKEHAPEEHPGIIEHVRARGQTPAGRHVPILVDEVLAVLEPGAGERGVDATLGFGGHAERFLQRLAPGGRLLALDVDPIELPKTEARLRSLGYGEEAFLVRRSNFAGLSALLHEIGWSDGADFIFADLGASSMQLDDPARGFSFKLDGPLDMRMNPARGLSAAQWIERASFHDWVTALTGADEPHAELLAGELVARSKAVTGMPRTQRELVDVIRGALRGNASEDDADLAVRRLFQAVRIEVNDELGALDALLRQLLGCLRPGGRAAFLTFHSGEDRRVKKAFQQGLREGLYSAASDEVIRAGPEERRDNPRSSAAKLRWARKASAS
jgi:16S rRNA (cytosine1402-N4)-methyltransferase